MTPYQKYTDTCTRLAKQEGVIQRARREALENLCRAQDLCPHTELDDVVTDFGMHTRCRACGACSPPRPPVLTVETIRECHKQLIAQEIKEKRARCPHAEVTQIFGCFGNKRTCNACGHDVLGA